MYRTNAQSRAIEEAFLRYGLRYQLVGGTRFYQRREVKDALAYLRVLRIGRGRGGLRADHQRARAGHRRADDRGAPGARGPARRRRLGGAERRGRGGSGGLATRTRTSLGAFVALITRLRTRVGLLALPELLDLVLEESGYRASLMDGSQEGEDRWANLLELREVVDRYGDLEPEDALDRLLEETALVADQDAYAADADAVHAHHAARRQGPRVRRRVHRRAWRRASSPTPGRWTIRARWRRSGGSRTWA